jgi:hypothetical protein
MKIAILMRGLLAAGVLAWLPADIRAQGPAPCGCTDQDKLDLKSRIQQTDAAMRELDRMIKFWQGRNNGGMTLEDGGNQQDVSHEEFREGVLMRELGFGMYPAFIKGARAFGARTNAACEVVVPPQATQCLRGALADHEAVHAKACKANKSLNPFADWRSAQTIVDYLKEEREGYQKENERLKKEQDLQNKQCQPTQPDASAKQQAEQAVTQQERNDQASQRLQMYGAALKAGGTR